MGAARGLFHKVALAAAIGLILSAVGTAQTQDYPKGPIIFIIPLGTSGSADLLDRFFAHQLSEHLGQPVVDEDRPSAGANIRASATPTTTPWPYSPDP